MIVTRVYAGVVVLILYGVHVDTTHWADTYDRPVFEAGYEIDQWIQVRAVQALAACLRDLHMSEWVILCKEGPVIPSILCQVLNQRNRELMMPQDDPTRSEEQTWKIIQKCEKCTQYESA